MTDLVIYEPDQLAPFLPQISAFDYLLPPHEGISPLPSFDPSWPAFIDGKDGRVLTRGGLRENALRLLTGLRNLGVKRGDTALIWAYNSLEWVTAAYGSLAAGVVVSPANYAYTPKELAHQVNDSGASVAFIDVAMLDNFLKARKHFKRPFPDSHIVLLCKPEDKPKEARKYAAISEIFGKPAAEPEHFNGGDCLDTAWMSYSSGTTGLPKGVMTTHFNITSQLQAANVVWELTGGPGGDVIFGFLPMSHIYGATISVLQPMSYGAPVVVLPRFEEKTVYECVQRYKVTVILLVPPLILLFIHSPIIHQYDLSSLRSAMSGGAPLSPELASAFETKFPHCISIQGYGMTETTPNITTMGRSEARPGWVGRLIPTYQARLVREDGTDAPRGEAGELWVRGPSVMKGYHNNPEATAKTMAPGWWFKTGDVLVRDEKGWFKVVDRVKELIKYKGLQVAPADLEAILLTHPGVVDAAVIGVYDKAAVTELPRAYIVSKAKLDDAGRAQFSKDVDAWVAGRVANHKKLRGGVIVVDSVPKSPSGKILRKDLRKNAQAEFEAEATKGKQARL